MADKLKQIPQKLLDIWKSWSVKQRVLIIGSIVAFIAVVSIVAIVLTRPKYEVLVTCEDYTEMNSVTTLLTDNNHKYKINNMVVSVNSKELTACKMLLASICTAFYSSYCIYICIGSYIFCNPFCW